MDQDCGLRTAKGTGDGCGMGGFSRVNWQCGEGETQEAAGSGERRKKNSGGPRKTKEEPGSGEAAILAKYQNIKISAAESPYLGSDRIQSVSEETRKDGLQYSSLASEFVKVRICSEK